MTESLAAGWVGGQRNGADPANATSIPSTPAPNRTDMKTPARYRYGQLYYSDSDSLRRKSQLTP